MQDIDLSDIARGRRITAVCATEMKLTPRQQTRPKVSKLNRKMKKLSHKMKKAMLSLS